jgi:hypothetical protein
MLRMFDRHPKRMARHASSAFALLAAIVLDTVLVVPLFHLTFHFQLGDPYSPAPPNTEPQHAITYVTLSLANKTPARTVVKVRTPSARSARTSSRSLAPTVVESPTAPIDSVAGSLESSPQRSRQGFQAVMPRAVERTRAEVIDSIIETAIQPGNDSAARMRRARRNAVGWTVDVRGERYGVSPGELHLGPITIRVPLVFAEPLSFDSDRRRSSRWVTEDTQSHAARAVRDAAFDSAVSSIRLRRQGGRLLGTDSVLRSQRNQGH